MPVENINPVKFPPRKYYIGEEDMADMMVFYVEECLAQYLRDLKTPDFTSVYEGFDFMAVWDFGHWCNAGCETERLKALKDAYGGLKNA